MRPRTARIIGIDREFSFGEYGMTFRDAKRLDGLPWPRFALMAPSRFCQFIFRSLGR